MTTGSRSGGAESRPRVGGAGTDGGAAVKRGLARRLGGGRGVPGGGGGGVGRTGVARPVRTARRRGGGRQLSDAGRVRRRRVHRQLAHVLVRLERDHVQLRTDRPAVRCCRPVSHVQLGTEETDEGDGRTETDGHAQRHQLDLTDHTPDSR